MDENKTTIEINSKDMADVVLCFRKLNKLNYWRQHYAWSIKEKQEALYYRTPEGDFKLRVHYSSPLYRNTQNKIQDQRRRESTCEKQYAKVTAYLKKAYGVSVN